MALQLKAIQFVHGSRALRLRSIAIVQGSRAFRLQAMQLRLAGKTPNNTLPLVTP